MSSLDPIEGVFGVSSVNPYDPSHYTASGAPSSQSSSSIESLAQSMVMSKEQEKKFIYNQSGIEHIFMRLVVLSSLNYRFYFL